MNFPGFYNNTWISQKCNNLTDFEIFIQKEIGNMKQQSLFSWKFDLQKLCVSLIVIR